MKTKIVIIVAGGKGLRMGEKLPKQFLLANNLPVLMHTINSFVNTFSDISIILVLPKEHVPYWENLCNDYNFNVNLKIAEGGETRFQSVKNGLKLAINNSIIAIHDGVRPLVSKAIIKECFNKAEKLGNAIPAISIFDSVREINESDSKIVDRNNYKIVQTPQVFKSEILQKAYDLPYNNKFTDDASVVEELGEKINLVEGNRENIKITTKYDLEIFKSFLKNNK